MMNTQPTRLFALCITAAAAALLVTACGGGNEANENANYGTTYAAASGTSAPNAVTGQTLYGAYCASCHGAGYPNAKDANRTLSAIASDKGRMGYLSATITAQGATDIAAYLQYGVTATTAGATTTTVSTATTTTTGSTTGTATNGKTLYASNNCGGCHGTPPNAALNKTLAHSSSLSAEYTALSGAINAGSGGMGMYKTTLTQPNLYDIAAYLTTPSSW